MFVPLSNVPNANDYRKDEDSGTLSRIFRGVLGLGALSATLGIGYTVGKKLGTGIFDKQRMREISRRGRRSAYQQVLQSEEQLYKTKIAYNKFFRRSSGLYDRSNMPYPGSYIHPEAQVLKSMFEDITPIDKGILRASDVESKLRDIVNLADPDGITALQKRQYGSFKIHHVDELRRAKAFIGDLTGVRTELKEAKNSLRMIVAERETHLDNAMGVRDQIDDLLARGEPAEDLDATLRDLNRNISGMDEDIRLSRERTSSILKRRDKLKADMVDFYSTRENVLIDTSREYVDTLQSKWEDIFRGIEKKQKGSTQITDAIKRYTRKTSQHEAMLGDMGALAAKEGDALKHVTDKIIRGVREDWSQDRWVERQKVQHITGTRMMTLSSLEKDIGEVFRMDKVPFLREGVVKIDLSDINTLDVKAANRKIAEKSIQFIAKSEEEISKYHLGRGYSNMRRELRNLEKKAAVPGASFTSEFTADAIVDTFLSDSRNLGLEGDKLFKQYKKRIGYGFENLARMKKFAAVSAGRESNIYTMMKKLQQLAPHMKGVKEVRLDMEDLDSVVNIVFQQGGKKEVFEVARIPYMVNNVTVDPKTGYMNAVAGVVDYMQMGNDMVGQYRSYADFYASKINESLETLYYNRVGKIFDKTARIPDLTADFKGQIKSLTNKLNIVRTDMGGDTSAVKMAHKTTATVQHGKPARWINARYVKNIQSKIRGRIDNAHQHLANDAYWRNDTTVFQGRSYSKTQLMDHVDDLRKEIRTLSYENYGENKLRNAVQLAGGEENKYFLYQGRMLHKFFDAADIVETSMVKGIINRSLYQGYNVTFDIPIQKKVAAAYNARQIPLEAAAELDNLYPRTMLNRATHLIDKNTRVADIPMKVAFIFGEHTKEGSAIYNVDSPGLTDLQPFNSTSLNIKAKIVKDPTTGEIVKYMIPGQKGTQLKRATDGRFEVILPKGKEMWHIFDEKQRPVTIRNGDLISDIRMLNTSQQYATLRMTYLKRQPIGVIGTKAVSMNGSIKALIHHTTDSMGMADILTKQGVKGTRERLAKMDINLIAYNKLNALKGTANIIEMGKMFLHSAVDDIYKYTNDTYVDSIKQIIKKVRAKSFSIDQRAEKVKLAGFVDALRELDKKRLIPGRENLGLGNLVTEIAQARTPAEMNGVLAKYNVHEVAMELAEERMKNNVKKMYNYAAGVDNLITNEEIKIGTINRNLYKDPSELYTLMEDATGVVSAVGKKRSALVINYDKVKNKVRMMNAIDSDRYGHVLRKLAENPEELYDEGIRRIVEDDMLDSQYEKAGNMSAKSMSMKYAVDIKSKTILDTHHGNKIYALKMPVIMANQDVKQIEAAVAADVQMSIGGSTNGIKMGAMEWAVAKHKGLDSLARDIENTMKISRNYVNDYSAILTNVITDQEAVPSYLASRFRSARERGMADMFNLKGIRHKSVSDIFNWEAPFNRATEIAQRLTEEVTEGVDPRILKDRPEAYTVEPVKIKQALLGEELRAYRAFVNDDANRRIINLRNIKFNVDGVKQGIVGKIDLYGKDNLTEISKVMMPQLYGRGIDYWTTEVFADIKDKGGKMVRKSVEVAHLNDVHRSFLQVLGVVNDAQERAKGAISRGEFNQIQEDVNNSLSKYFKRVVEHRQYAMREKAFKVGMASSMRGVAMPEMGFKSESLMKKMFGTNIQTTFDPRAARYKITPKPMNILVSRSRFRKMLEGTEGWITSRFGKEMDMNRYVEGVMKGQYVHMANIVKYPTIGHSAMNSIRMSVFDDTKLPQHLADDLRGKVLINRLDQSYQQALDFDSDILYVKLATDQAMNDEAVANMIDDRVRIQYKKIQEMQKYSGEVYNLDTLYQKLPDWEDIYKRHKNVGNISARRIKTGEDFLKQVVDATGATSMEELLADDIIRYKVDSSGRSTGKIKIKGSLYRKGYEDVRDYVAREYFEKEIGADAARTKANRILRNRFKVSTDDSISLFTGVEEHTFDVDKVNKYLKANREAQDETRSMFVNLFDMSKEQLNDYIKDGTNRDNINRVLRKIKSDALEPYLAVKELTGVVTNQSQRMWMAAMDRYGVFANVANRRKMNTIVQYTKDVVQNIISSKHMTPIIVGDFLDTISQISKMNDMKQSVRSKFVDKLATGNYEAHKTQTQIRNMETFANTFDLVDAFKERGIRMRSTTMSLRESVNYLDLVNEKIKGYLDNPNNITPELDKVESLLTAAGRDGRISSTLGRDDVLRLLKEEAGRNAKAREGYTKAMGKLSLNKIIGDEREARRFISEDLFPHLRYMNKWDLFNDPSYAFMRGKTLPIGEARMEEFLLRGLAADGAGGMAALQREILQEEVKVTARESVRFRHQRRAARARVEGGRFGRNLRTNRVNNIVDTMSNARGMLLAAAAGFVGTMMFAPAMDLGPSPGIGGEYDWGRKRDERDYNQRKALSMVSGAQARVMVTAPSAGGRTFASLLSTMAGDVIPEPRAIERGDTLASRVLRLG